MTSEPRSRLSPEERRAQLVAIGVRFLAEHPLDELTIEELARQAGVSKALIFHYFESRQGVERAIVTTARDSLLLATEPRMDLAPRERIRDTLLRIAGFVRDHSGTFSSLVRGVASGDPAVREIVDESRELNALRLREAFEELGVPDEPALRVALRAWVSFAEETMLELIIDRGTDEDAVVDFLEATLDGVVAAARTARF
ncbi:TetR/AcrR family transcriptional regulator [Microbacterium hydrocarbonoxydans]|uniref:TetR/AcrR family transcriptional regulator n=1 Tax=Microbacterium hydrocarbonoxydans TaxID=273678 RepID=UPI0007BAE869|nr:TetR/AcrR family transcriptional regulator [Microbacterium hydrocarbonoxydans]GAT73493.1 regulatory protein TetR [Microbacterium sp. HM58-2]